ncbi:MAG: glycosyltransferase family 4 protein [Myxococcales bacterium]|nr:glycosyltransferase family 4 protein [Myxococcales bacterium]
MAEPTRVLVLNERDPRHPKAGGAEVHLAELAPRMRARGFEFTQLACSFRDSAAEERVDDLHVVRLGPLPVYYPRAAYRCARETRRGHYDVVIEVLAKLPFYASLYSGVPVLAICHHLFGRTAFLQVPWPVAATVVAAEYAIPTFYRRVPFVVGSPSTRDDLVARGIGAERIRLIHYGAGSRETATSTAATPLAQRKQRVCYLGRLEPYKQVDVMLRAVARLTDRFPDVEVLVIGRGIEQPRLEAVARELGIADRTRFTGFVSDAERDALLESSRVCVCPSTKEGWGLTVIDANSCGVPVVASDVPGLRDSVRDAQTGFLVPDTDVDAFAERIGRLLDDDDLAARMGDDARAWSRRFDWDQAADDLADSLRAVKRAS